MDSTCNAKRIDYRFGNASIRIHTNNDALIRDLQEYYSNYENHVHTTPDVFCDVRSTDDRDVMFVQFIQPQPFDAGAFALSLLQHPYDDPHFTQMQGSPHGWLWIGRPGGSDPVVVANASSVWINVRETPLGFITDYLLSTVLSRQTELLFVHAASLAIKQRGVLLVGPTGRGKTTLSMALASSGHRILGDDIAPIRITTGEILPFRQAARIRKGPRSSAVDLLLQKAFYETERSGAGEERVRVPLHLMFPNSSKNPVPVSHVFFLMPFADKPATEIFTPRLNNVRWKELSLNNTLLTFWGVPEEKRLMQFLIFQKLLSKSCCYLLHPGSPEATARLIESVLEVS